MGDDSSTRRPTAETILSMMWRRCLLSWKVRVVFFKLAAALNIDEVAGVHQDIADGVVLQQRLQGAESEDFFKDFAG